MFEKGGDSRNVNKPAVEFPRIVSNNIPPCEPDYLKPTEQELYTIERVMWATRHLATKREPPEPKKESSKSTKKAAGARRLLPITVVAPPKVIPETYKCNVLDIHVHGLPPIQSKRRTTAIVRYVRRAESKKIRKACELPKRSAPRQDTRY